MTNLELPNLAGINPPVISGPTASEKSAWEIQLYIRQLSRNSQVTFLKMGELLWLAQQERHWIALHYDSFREYCEDLNLPVEHSYSWATRLIGIWEEFVLSRQIREHELTAIGVTKLARLLPAARKGKLDDELIEKARELSDMDLRIELGHRIPEADHEHSVICPNCGTTIWGVKRVAKKE